MNREILKRDNCCGDCKFLLSVVFMMSAFCRNLPDKMLFTKEVGEAAKDVLWKNIEYFMNTDVGNDRNILY